MQNRRTIKNEIDLTHTLHILAEAYEEISVIRMQRVKSSVLSTREFLDSLSEVFFDLKASYKQQIEAILARKGKLGKSHFAKRKTEKYMLEELMIAKKKKTLSVLISSNTKFYGNIIDRVFNLFIENIKRYDSDILIIGRVGRELFEERGIKRDYKYLTIPDFRVEAKDLAQVINVIVEYEKINVFYGRFVNIVTQLPTVSTVSGEEPLRVGVELKHKVSYFFEPSLEAILHFFESQVFASLFKQTVHEFELSRLASRITAMEEALTNIERSEAKINDELTRYKRLTRDKKQIERLGGMMLWKR